MLHNGRPSTAARRAAGGQHGLLSAFLTAACLVAAIGAPPWAHGQLRESAAQRIAHTMGNPEFRPKSFRGGTWLGNGDFYLDLEPSASGTGSDIVKYATATGAREILVAAERLIPAGEKTPLPVEDYALSPDRHRVLVFSNSKTVWRRNTRGDYWVLDLTTGTLRKLGGEAPASSLMFAKFSPDNRNVGYVRANNI